MAGIRDTGLPCSGRFAWCAGVIASVSFLLSVQACSGGTEGPPGPAGTAGAGGGAGGGGGDPGFCVRTGHEFRLVPEGLCVARVYEIPPVADGVQPTWGRHGGLLSVARPNAYRPQLYRWRGEAATEPSVVQEEHNLYPLQELGYIDDIVKVLYTGAGDLGGQGEPGLHVADVSVSGAGVELLGGGLVHGFPEGTGSIATDAGGNVLVRIGSDIRGLAPHQVLPGGGPGLAQWDIDRASVLDLP